MLILRILTNAEEALKTITDIMFEPINKEDTELILKDFNMLASLNLSLGNLVEIEGYVTYVSKVHQGNGNKENDADVHFNVSTTPTNNNGNGKSSYLICEIQNADKEKHKAPLDAALQNGDKVIVRGVLRIFLEHIEKTSQVHQFPHIFELHPVHSVIINRQELEDILPMDCPGRTQWQENNSIYKMKLQQDGSVGFKKIGEDTWTAVREQNLSAVYNGKDLVFENIPMAHGFRAVGHNYISFDGQFSKIQTEPFTDGKPYMFELKSPDDSSLKIKAISIPDTPAYEIARRYDRDPPNRTVTAVSLRGLEMNQLMNNTYETVLCPAYRLA